MLEISEQDILQSLGRDNPWWVSPRPEVFHEFAKRRAYFDAFSKISLNWDVRRAAPRSVKS